MAFYAYSPIAGGFLAKTKEQILNPPPGRWDPSTLLGQIYHKLYNKPAMLAALDTWGEISKDTGIPKAELAYRWIAYHSILRGELGDGIIVGATSIDQLKQTLKGLKNGPLSEEVAGRINDIWKSVEHQAPLDNFNEFGPIRS